MNPNKIYFPCGICGNACSEIESIKYPQFEDQSIGYDKCDKWFHFMCVNITGNEPNVQAGSDLPYFCPTCQEPNSTIDGNTPTSSAKGKGKGKGKSSAKKISAIFCSNKHSTTSSLSTSLHVQQSDTGTTLWRSTRTWKSKTHQDYHYKHVIT